jgi:Fis family transcriptional regulator
LAHDRLAAVIRAWLDRHLTERASGEVSAVYGDFLCAAEPALLGEVMRRVQGNRWSAARLLGLNRATVRKKLAAYGLGGANRSGDSGAPP